MDLSSTGVCYGQPSLSTSIISTSLLWHWVHLSRLGIWEWSNEQWKWNKNNGTGKWQMANYVNQPSLVCPTSIPQRQRKTWAKWNSNLWYEYTSRYACRLIQCCPYKGIISLLRLYASPRIRIKERGSVPWNIKFARKSSIGSFGAIDVQKF
jgi:hypothetical protein